MPRPQLLIALSLAAAAHLTSGGAAFAQDDGYVGQIDLVSPVAGDEYFGGDVLVLENGNYLITDPRWDDGATEDVGAVYLYDGLTDTVISTLTGSQHGDRVGTRVMEVGDSDAVVVSGSWDDGAVEDVGAVTWVDGELGLDGTVSAANSVVGTSPGDSPSATPLDDGDYAVVATGWDLGAIEDVGAVRLADGTTGAVGPLTVANSLHGSSTGDRVGYVTSLGEGDFLVQSPYWDDGPVVDVGAATFVDDSTGLVGPVTTANSLHGTNSNDRVGSDFPLALESGEYLVRSQSWNGVGAVTLVDREAGPNGPVTIANSLYGASSGDGGSFWATELVDGDIVTAWPSWSDGPTAAVGAVLWHAAGSPLVGPVEKANSLHGTSENDRVGQRGVQALTNGHYIVGSPDWDLGAVEDVGAVTLGDGASGTTGAVGPGNSLHGSQDDDSVGRDIVPLSNGNAVVSSVEWDLGGIADVGAVTWVDGDAGLVGPVTTANSLHGSAVEDRVGGAEGSSTRSLGVAALDNGHYVVASPFWDDGPTTDVGAVTWVDGTTGAVGAVSASNSLHGTSAGDSVGGQKLSPGSTLRIAPMALPGGNFVVSSSEWDNGPTVDVGAVTWVDGAIGATGPVTTANSLYGATASDHIGHSYPGLLETGDYVVRSFRYDDGANVDATAYTFGFGDRGISGPVSRDNSAVGTPTVSPVLGFQSSPKLTGSGSVLVETSQDRAILLRLELPDPDPDPHPVPVIVSTEPERLLDSRSGTDTIDGDQAGSGPLAGGEEIEIPIAGRGAIPADAEAVVANVTAINPVGRGFVTIHPCGDRPLASSLNYGAAGAVVGNEVIAKLSSAGSICVFTSASTHLTVDAVGFVPTGSPYASVDPVRLLETRVGEVTVDGVAAGGGPVVGGEEIELQVAGRGEVPVGASAAVLNVTAINPVGRGFVTIHPCGDRPLASSLNYGAAGAVVGNEVIAKLSSAGTVCIYTQTTTELTADLVGHLPSGTGYSPLDPVRLLETRVGEVTVDGVAAGGGPVVGGEEIELQVAGRGEVPVGASAAVLNVTAINPVGRGFVTIHPCGDRPLASSLNYGAAGAVVGNEVIAKLSSAGTVCIYTQTTTELTADLVGHLVSDA